MYRIHLGVEQEQMKKTLIGPLSFLTVKPLFSFHLLNAIFDFWVFLLIFLKIVLYLAFAYF